MGKLHDLENFSRFSSAFVASPQLEFTSCALLSDVWLCSYFLTFDPAAHCRIRNQTLVDVVDFQLWGDLSTDCVIVWWERSPAFFILPIVYLKVICSSFMGSFSYSCRPSVGRFLFSRSSETLIVFGLFFDQKSFIVHLGWINPHFDFVISSSFPSPPWHPR
jgi:hypothetical protein